LRQEILALRLPHAQSPLGVVTASIGVAALDMPGDGGAAAPSLIAEADRRLYEAKRSGRNRVCADGCAPPESGGQAAQ
ncbi:diguanylate cyclase, partial [Acinetobacter baumannii]|nr:diguanylate cyclase [Acinetobacter baumannii]